MGKKGGIPQKNARKKQKALKNNENLPKVMCLYRRYKKKGKQSKNNEFLKL